MRLKNMSLWKRFIPLIIELAKRKLANDTIAIEYLHTTPGFGNDDSRFKITFNEGVWVDRKELQEAADSLAGKSAMLDLLRFDEKDVDAFLEVYMHHHTATLGDRVRMGLSRVAELRNARGK